MTEAGEPQVWDDAPLTQIFHSVHYVLRTDLHKKKNLSKLFKRQKNTVNASINCNIIVIINCSVYS